MSKLKYCLWQEGKSVNFQVLKMDERFRRGEGREKVFRPASHPFLSVISMDCPELNTNEIYLRGEEESADFDIVSLTFSTYGEAANYIAKVHEVLENWANEWDGWAMKSPPSEEPTSSNYIFTLD